eukprot:3217680-Heterocapsa_arctica.AAC.1
MAASMAMRPCLISVGRWCSKLSVLSTALKPAGSQKPASTWSSGPVEARASADRREDGRVPEARLHWEPGLLWKQGASAEVPFELHALEQG